MKDSKKNLLWNLSAFLIITLIVVVPLHVPVPRILASISTYFLFTNGFVVAIYLLAINIAYTVKNGKSFFCKIISLAISMFLYCCFAPSIFQIMFPAGEMSYVWGFGFAGIIGSITLLIGGISASIYMHYVRHKKSDIQNIKSDGLLEMESKNQIY